MTPKDVHPSIQFQGLYSLEELSIMKVSAGQEALLLVLATVCSIQQFLIAPYTGVI